MSGDLSLEARSGLPEHLRVLAEKYPRGDWTGHTNFNELTRFWLDRHLMFRDLLQRMQADTEGVLDKRLEARPYAMQLSRLGGFFINQLHSHHHIEDAHYFPLLQGKDARLVRGFELLDADHHALDGHLNALADETNAVLRAVQAGGALDAAAERYRKTLVRFGRFLDRHLTDEEEIVVPVILEHGGDDLM